MTDKRTRDKWYRLDRSPRWILELSDDEVKKLNEYVKSEEMELFNERLIEENLE